jgi:N-acetylneuraminic acid mutarotase
VRRFISAIGVVLLACFAAGAQPATTAPFLPPLPQPASSFGAVVSGDWLYVYGGHVADTHSYSTSSVSGQFHRLNLKDPQKWEDLPGGPPLQGLNLATWHGKVFRVGGMNPTNKEGEKADVRSVADCACFDPQTRQWSDLPPMPEPRSSHDVVVAGNKLIVIGGWKLSGDSDDAVWADTSLVLDLAAVKPQWKSVNQPFQRRAFMSAVLHGKVYVIGGFVNDSDPTRDVQIYDPVADTWAKGPELPGKDENGFGPAACTLNDTLYASVADGSLYRLNARGDGWEKIAKTTPRIVHRLAPDGDKLLVLGGAARMKQLDLIEAVEVSTPANQAKPK